MLNRFILGAAGVACLLAAVPASAQQPATLVLHSTERIAGDLIDLGGAGFAIRVNGQDRQVPAEQVAIVQFAGPGSVAGEVRSRLEAGQMFAVLRNGQIVEGRLVDIGGSNPLRLSFATSSGNRDLTSNEVAQIYFGNLAPAAVATTGSGTVAVPANQEWVPASLAVRSGEMLTFAVSGQVRFGPNPEHTYPAGGSRRIGTRQLGTGQLGPNAPMPRVPLGALIGRVNDGQPFEITNSGTKMPATGTLYLQVNDDIVSDNSGAFQVTISR